MILSFSFSHHFARQYHNSIISVQIMEIFLHFLWCLYLMLLEDGWQEYYQRENFGFCDGALVSTQVWFSFILRNIYNILKNDDIQLLFFTFCLTGPFNIKEHVCIFVATGAGGGSAYATVCIMLFYIYKPLTNEYYMIGHNFHTRTFLSSLNQFWSRFSFAYEHTDYRVWSRGIS